MTHPGRHAADLGRALGGGAHLSALRRTAVGPFELSEAHDLEHLQLLGMVEGVRHLGHVVVDDELAAAVRHGRVLDAEQLGLPAPIGTDAGPWAVLSGDGELLAVYQRRDDRRAKPAIVLAAEAG